jgi:NRAMP (natural resistance-associated macrophage protein)-like metal ion transporter
MTNQRPTKSTTAKAPVSRKLTPPKSAANKASGKNQSTWLQKLGPGLVTGAADDDPSGIATYSQAGAQFGFGMLWTILLTYPLMVSVQMISALIGCVSGHGLATNIRHNYSIRLLYVLVLLLMVANTINIAADIAAMGEALQLLVGGPDHLYGLGFGLLSLLLQIFVPYSKYVRILKWLTLTLFAYVATVFTVDIAWVRLFKGALTPDIVWNPAYITTVVAVFGTTISPYLFFWQASQEVEEQRGAKISKVAMRTRGWGTSSYERIKIDTLLGMGISNIVAFFIILTTAVTLHQNGVTDIQSSAEAASALRPVAGEFAFWLFSAGIIGTGLLAIPVLAGSAAYAMAGTFKWKNSLEYKPEAAKEFYSIIAVATVLGVALSFTSIDPIKALYWSAVINGVIAVPIMVVMMCMGSNRKVMGDNTISARLRFMGWLSTAVMGLAILAMAWITLMPAM